jgi:hypothetical protein
MGAENNEALGKAFLFSGQLYTLVCRAKFAIRRVFHSNRGL